MHFCKMIPVDQTHFSKKYYIYVLRSRADKTYYVGYTSNIKRRIKEHNKGKHKYTKGHIPYEIVYSESFNNMNDAKERESYIKRYGNMSRFLKNRVPPSTARD